MYLHSYHLYWWEFLKQNCTGRRDSCPGGKTPATSTLRSSLFLRGLPCWWRPLRSLQRRSAGLLQLSGAAPVAPVKSREEMTEKKVSCHFRCIKSCIKFDHVSLLKKQNPTKRPLWGFLAAADLSVTHFSRPHVWSFSTNRLFEKGQLRSITIYYSLIHFTTIHRS